MGKLKKFFSSTGWETSEFGGFSRILWDLPDMIIPSGFYISPSKELEYLTYYSQRKLMALFLFKAHQYGFSERLISTATASCETEDSRYSKRVIPKYTFNKKDVKEVLNLVIKKETELKALFIHYSNALVNSQITYEMYTYEFGDMKPDDIGQLELFKQTRLKTAFDKLEERKSGWSYSGSASFGGSMKRLKKDARFKVFEEYQYKEIEYTEQEIKDSDKLLEMLDISFEKADSKITSLRVGKVDIPKLAEVLSGNSHIYFRKEQLERTKPFSVCILCDESGSMGGYKFYVQHGLVKVLYRTFSQILPPDKLYVYGHTGSSTPVIHVYQDKFNPTFEKTFSLQHDIVLRENYDGPVTDLIYEKIRSYTDDNILFIVLSDGAPAGEGYGGQDDCNDFKRVIEKCKRDGFVTCGIGIQYLSVKELYQYSTVVGASSDESPVKKVSLLINNVVKSEFQ